MIDCFSLLNSIGKIIMKTLSYFLLILFIQPIVALAAPPDLPENWRQMVVSSIALTDDPKPHVCMMKQPNLPFKEMNCFNQILEIGVTPSELFYTDDNRFRPIVISCYCGDDNATDHDYWLESVGKKMFAPLYKGDSLAHARYPAYRYFLNANQQIIPKNECYQSHSKWECFAQQKGQYHYCRIYDKNSAK